MYAYFKMEMPKSCCENLRLWKPIPCKYCGGALSEIRERKDKNGKVIKRYRHCYSCHFEFEEA